MHFKDNIIALATPSGAGAIALIRISGEDAIILADKQFRSVSGKKLIGQKSHTLHLGHINDDTQMLDEVLVSIFKGPNSYTGENVVEISCHGSPYIQQQIIQLFLRNGCRMASAGEFTLRAFLNGKMDLSQAEAVADLIASDNEAAHQIALRQMRGGFSSEIEKLRAELLNFASLIELELDFSEEDVEFADRTEFEQLILRIEQLLKALIDSFAVGNVIKNGIPVAIVGKPNVGKSTLLNSLLNEERAIVSEIPGTTRDAIEDEISIGGIGFRFIDTAGIRETNDVVEGIGIRKTFEKIEQVSAVLFLMEASKLLQHTPSSLQASPSKGGELSQLLEEIQKVRNKYPQKPIILVVNKVDTIDNTAQKRLSAALGKVEGLVTQLLSAKTGEGIDELKARLVDFINIGTLRNDETIVTNTRHYDALLKALEQIQRVRSGMNEGLSNDLLAIDIREALHHLGEITGQVTNDELLGNIFSNFCIGK